MTDRKYTVGAVALVSLNGPSTHIPRCPRHVRFYPDKPTLIGGSRAPAQGQNGDIALHSIALSAIALRAFQKAI